MGEMMRSYKKITESKKNWSGRKFKKICSDEESLRKWTEYKIKREKIKSKAKKHEKSKIVDKIIKDINKKEGYVPLPYDIKANDNLVYTDMQLAEALYLSGGFVTDAAKRLKIAPTTIYKRLKKSEFLRLAMEAIEEERLDMTEKSLFKLIQQLHYPAVSFYLTQKGARRGYYDKKIIDQNINVSGQVKIDFSTVPKDVLAELAGWDDIIDIEKEIKELPLDTKGEEDD